MGTKSFQNAVAAIVVFICLLLANSIQANTFNVLVVMSYEKDNPWCKEIKEGIDSVLLDTSDITYFYMDTKIDIESGAKKAKKAYELFQQLKPDGVITADDNAQKMFVLPYLRDAHDTPVMFCGVNAQAAQYGYPTSNISGILERGHIRESIALAKQLIPSLKRIAFIAKDSPSGRALMRQVQSESNTYLAKVSFHFIKNIEDLSEIDYLLEEQADAIYMDSVQGVKDTVGNPLSNKDILRILTAQYNKPIIGANQYHVEQGALCAVVKAGQEQGRTAARMLLEAMRGTPVKEIPIAQNYKGKRVINVTALRSRNLHIRPIVLMGAKLIKSGEQEP